MYETSKQAFDDFFKLLDSSDPKMAHRIAQWALDSCKAKILVAEHWLMREEFFRRRDEADSARAQLEVYRQAFPICEAVEAYTRLSAKEKAAQVVEPITTESDPRGGEPETVKMEQPKGRKKKA